MSNLYSSAKLENIDVESNKALLEMINSKANNLQLEFCMQLCNIEDLFKYYVNKHAEHINDLDIYDCINIEIRENNFGKHIFTLNASDDEEDMSDILFLSKELRRHFGVSLLNCKLESVLNILLMDCVSYTIDDNIIKINIYYDNYKNTWIGEYFNNQQYNQS